MAGDEMTPEEHQAEHIRLHRALDELVACYLTENMAYPGNGAPAGSIRNEILDLMQWAYLKTLAPSMSPDEHQSDPRSPADFECERQMITLALAVLALSRPGFESAIREIVRRFDPDAQMFDNMKRANADQVKPTHWDLGLIPVEELDRHCPRCGHIHEGAECGAHMGGARYCRCVRAESMPA